MRVGSEFDSTQSLAASHSFLKNSSAGPWRLYFVFGFTVCSPIGTIRKRDLACPDSQ